MQHATVRDRTKGGKYALSNKQPPATASPAKGETLSYLKMLRKTNNVYKNRGKGRSKEDNNASGRYAIYQVRIIKVMEGPSFPRWRRGETEHAHPSPLERYSLLLKMSGFPSAAPKYHS